MNDARAKTIKRAFELAESACSSMAIAWTFEAEAPEELLRAERELREALQIIETLKDPAT